jgi:hypothetical protein
MELARRAVDEQTLFGDFLQKEGIRPVDQGDVDFSIGVQGLEVVNQLGVLVERRGHAFNQNR